MKVVVLVRFSLLLSLAVFILPIATPADADPTALVRDSAAPKANFSTPALYGFLKYRTIYGAQQDRIVIASFAVTKGARTQCMDYSDFSFTLRRQSGEIVPHVELSSISGAAAPPQFVIITPRAKNTPSPCPYGIRKYGYFFFALDKLYPKLVAAAYRFSVTFSPRDRSVPATAFPEIAFEIQK